jgi:Family of unknown function (DUF6071)
MHLYANGDSYTFGHGLTSHGAPNHEWGPTDYEHALQHSWPKLTADMLGWSFINDSWPGGSNDRIVRTTISWLCAHGWSDVFVAIGWSEPARREVYISEQDRYLHLGNLEQNIIRLQTDLGLNRAQASVQANAMMLYGWDDVESYMRYYTQVLLMSSFLRARSIPYVFFHSLDDSHAFIDHFPQSSGLRADALGLHAAIDWSDFLEYDHSIDCVFLRFSQKLPGMQLDATTHPTQIAHQHFAQLMKDTIARRLHADADDVV